MMFLSTSKLWIWQSAPALRFPFLRDRTVRSQAMNLGSHQFSNFIEVPGLKIVSIDANIQR